MAEQKTVVKKKTTTKAAVPDLIVKSSNLIEKLTKAKAMSMVDELMNENDFNLFKVGGVLAVIQDNGWFHDEGYETLKDFVEAKYDMQYRKAMYWISIYKALVESGVPWAKVQGIGWSKLRLIASELTLDNVDEYVEIANEMTQAQLVEYLKEQKKGSMDSGDEKPSKEDAVSEAKKLSTLTFKVHDDQKEVIKEALEEAKNNADTEFESVALEAICLDFLSSDKKPAKPAKAVNGFKNLKEAMAAASYEEVFEVFEELWPDIELSVELPNTDEEGEEEDEDE